MSKYHEHQMYQCCPLPVVPINQNGTIRIKVKSDRGETNWMNITPKQFKAIEELLIAGED